LRFVFQRKIIGRNYFNQTLDLAVDWVRSRMPRQAEAIDTPSLEVGGNALKLVLSALRRALDQRISFPLKKKLAESSPLSPAIPGERRFCGPSEYQNATRAFPFGHKRTEK